MGKSDGLLSQLGENLEKDEALRLELIKKIKASNIASCYRSAPPPPNPPSRHGRFDRPPLPSHHPQGVVVFNIDKQDWTLDLREGKGVLSKGAPADKADITLSMADATFVGLVSGKIGSQQAFLMRKLKINGSMALAMKMEPVLQAAAPKSKL
jgi:hypothetical protein